MDTHTFFLIMRNEMKLQMRSWVFRFFIVLSLVGIVAYQMYIHGAGSSAWKMVALPCSMPLMNAYLFSVVQSLFLIVIMSEFPQRLIRSGLRDGVMVRPFSNTVYYWGALTGIFLLFLLVNVVEVFVVILLVNSVNAAPLSLSLYFFYILELFRPLLSPSRQATTQTQPSIYRNIITSTIYSINRQCLQRTFRFKRNILTITLTQAGSDHNVLTRRTDRKTEASKIQIGRASCRERV